MTLSWLGVFGAGFLASLSPCVYPLIPLTIGFLGRNGKSSRDRISGVIAFALGQTTVFVGLAYLAVRLGESFGFTSQDRGVRTGVGVLLVVAGIASLLGCMPSFLERLNGRTQRNLGSGLGTWGGGLLMGAGAALLASPCTTPVLGSILALLAGTTTVASGLALMGLYSLGFLSLFLALGFGFVKVQRLPRSGPWLTRLHQVSSWLLILAGIYYAGSAWTSFGS